MAFAGAMVLGAVVSGCAVPSRAVVPTGGDRVVVVVSGTANEPRAAVTDAVLAVLRDAANSGNVSQQGSGKSSVVLISAADGGDRRSVVLTPRRADGSLEHGLSRPSLIDRNVASAVDAIGATVAHKSGLDLLTGIADAVRGVPAGTLVVDSSGLSTGGAFDLRQVGWATDPAAVVAQLTAARQLPRLDGWHVVFAGLGSVAGPQPPLPTPARDRLAAYWQAICRAAGAAACDVDQSRVPAEPSRAAAATPVVPVPGVTSVTGPRGEVTTTVSDTALGFTGNSAVLSESARDLLRSLAGSITAGRSDAPVTVRGFAADPPGSTDAGRRELAEQRARAVAGALTGAGVTQRVDATGTGTEPGVTAVTGGRFDEAAAARMRRVEITYQGPGPST
ncbi:OmpA family protein [Amycolatopsis solani]|uniref:OmpA family protein n=1 Tax=Amycolatopsis solani TaxID=3028615 RepID=UPI00296FC487|nr:OmpA family protein [Amycolatopsis sp. MEP2-6]